MSSLHEIENDEEHNDDPINENTPVEPRRVWVGRRREEHEYPSDRQETERDNIDRCAGFAEGPAGRRKGLAAKALGEDAGNADDVGGEESGEGLVGRWSACRGWHAAGRELTRVVKMKKAVVLPMTMTDKMTVMQIVTTLAFISNFLSILKEYHTYA